MSIRILLAAFVAVAVMLAVLLALRFFRHRVDVKISF